MKHLPKEQTEEIKLIRETISNQFDEIEKECSILESYLYQRSYPTSNQEVKPNDLK